MGAAHGPSRPPRRRAADRSDPRHVRAAHAGRIRGTDRGTARPSGRNRAPALDRLSDARAVRPRRWLEHASAARGNGGADSRRDAGGHRSLRPHGADGTSARRRDRARRLARGTRVRGSDGFTYAPAAARVTAAGRERTPPMSGELWSITFKEETMKHDNRGTRRL